jgi:phage replication O-like protein O
MADVQLENGCVAIAHDLYLAIARGGFTALERGVLDAVAYLTYGANKSKSEISTEDIRYLLGAGDSLRTDRLNEAITKLLSRRILFRQELTNGKQLLAIQKDYEQWTDKMSPTLQGINYLKGTNYIPIRVPDKMSPTPPERLLEYAQSASKFRYGIGAWRAERKQARLLYTEVLEKTKSGDEAFNLITDYIDFDEWMRNNVKMQFTYMSSRFEAWRSQIPRKPREIRENEEATGRRYRYDVKQKQWRAKS